MLAGLTFLRFVAGLVAGVWRELRNPDNPEFRQLLLLVAVILGTGTLFYHTVEGWRWLDALYFSVITLATVGFGDLSPKTDLGKIFTMVYLLLGLGVLAAFVSVLGRHVLDQPRRVRERRLKRRAARPPAAEAEAGDDD